MNDGVLLLRLVLGALMAGHALQKLAGWFSGMGLEGTAQLFEAWGLRPGRLMVFAAGVTELLGAFLIATGLLTTLGVACVVGTMVVAASTSRPNGLWAVKHGYELPALYALLGVGIGLIGPGRYSLDDHFGLLQYTNTGYVLAATVLAIVGAAPLVRRVTQTHARTNAVMGGASR